MKNAFLIGNTIYLRGLEENDLNNGYIQWFNDSEVCQYNSHHVFPFYKKNAENYIKNSQDSQQALILAIVDKSNDTHIGNITLQNINYLNKNAEFAIIIGEKKFWGKGIAKEASLLILQHGFQELNLHRIYCGTSAKNIAMQKLADYLGMDKEGRRKDAFFKHGEYVDIIEYGILRQAFLTKFNFIKT